MSRHPQHALRSGLLALLAAGCGRGEPAATRGAGAAPADPTDVVLIVIDTLRADALLDPEGLYDTPNLDRLARDGIVFTRAFTHAPMTLPAHTSLFSSRLPLETTVMNNGTPVPEDVPLVTEWLRRHGYGTRAVVSLATLDHAQGRASVRRGFDEYDSYFMNMAPAEGTNVRLLASLERRDAQRPLFLFAHYADPHEPYNAHGTEHREARFSIDGAEQTPLRTSDETQWIRVLRLEPGRTVFDLRSDDPFKVRTFECHEDGVRREPLWEEGQHGERTRAARVVIDRGDSPAADCEVKIWINDIPRTKDILGRYRLEVAHVDRYVGELLARLEELGLYRDSLIVFTSDHGEAMGEHGQYGHVEGLTDDQIHVPLIIKLPAGDPRAADLARSAERIVPHVDLVPTLLDLLGLPPLPGQRGASILAPHEVLHFAETHRPEAKQDKVALRDERFKMIYVGGEERFLMYDLAADPGEERDVFEERRAERPEWPQRLRSLYQASQELQRVKDVPDEDLQRELEALGYGGKE